ncbi:hypothetical protein [Gemmatimonas sp.]|uniref:hypothetical protein n=1 Tax=Gemmatimonas sp. TaxID=1962908 RepID=UPI0039836D7E
MRRTWFRLVPAVWLGAAMVLSAPARAQVRVNPTGVSVNAMNATTVFLTFGGVSAALRPAEGVWCGELVSAAPDRGSRCNAATIYGQLPGRYDLSRRSGQGGFTDIMSIPASVSRRAYLAARNGAVATFFYVRHFQNLAGGPDEYIAVTCRLTGGQANVPFALTDVRVQFAGGDNVQVVQAGESPPAFSANITYNGTGQLVGRWEVVLPGEEPPADADLIAEGALPREARGSQRRFSQVQRFNVFVPPGTSMTLRGPDPARLPSASEGTYLVLLRLEASDDRAGDSDLGDAGAGTGLVHAGAVAGFPMPVLRYVVLGDGAPVARGGRTRLAPLEPAESAESRTDSTFRIRWSPEPGASTYGVELESVTGTAVWSALLPAITTDYEVPALVWSRETVIVRWRATAYDADGHVMRRSGWRRVALRGAAPQ